MHIILLKNNMRERIFVSIAAQQRQQGRHTGQNLAIQKVLL